MKKTGLALLMLLLLTACSKEYPYADQLFEFYEELVDDYEDAESVDELKQLRQAAYQKRMAIEKEQQASQVELVHDMELFEEDAYLVHLDLLKAESYAGWMYLKRKNELETVQK